MKLNNKAKLTFGVTFFTIVYIFCIYLGFKNQNIDLSKVDKITSIVQSRGIDIRYGSKGKEDQVFYIKLRDLDKKLGIYRMSKNYEDLIQTINIGDEITIFYYKNSNRKENVNIDLIQVERNGNVVINKSEFEKKERFLIYIGIGGIIANVLIFIYQKRKYFKVKSVS